MSSFFFGRSDSAKWGWLLEGRGRETRERRGWKWFWRGQTDLTRYRGIFADEKTVGWEDFSVVSSERRVVKA